MSKIPSWWGEVWEVLAEVLLTADMDGVGYLDRWPSLTGISLVSLQEKEKDKNLSLKQVIEFSKFCF